MFRRSSLRGFLLLAIAVAILFVPIAAGAASDSTTQTLTLLALVLGIALTGLVWLGLGVRRVLRVWYYGLSAAAGSSLAVVWITHTAGAGEAAAELAYRLLIAIIAFGIGIWLYALAMRLIFPRPIRAFAAAVIVLLLVGLAPLPWLLFQPSTAELRITDVELQLHAGYLFWTIGLALLVAPFFALATLPGDWFERWWTAATQRVMSIPSRWYAIGISAVAFGLALFFMLYSFGRRPTTADEVAQLWHARMLLTGRLAMPPDPNPEFFAIDNIIDRPVWMSQFPIGGPAVLAIGLLFGVPWLLNPLLTGLTAWNVYRFSRRTFGDEQARAASAVFATAPMVLIMGGTYMNHAPTAFLATLALVSLAVWSDSIDARTLARHAAVVGLSAGIAVAIRPLDGVVMTVVFGLYMLWLAALDRSRIRSLFFAIAAGAIPVAFLLYANWRTTGNPIRFGYEVLWGANHSLGLHDDPTGHPHTAWRALLLGTKYAVQLNWIATAWPVPIMFVVVAGLLFSRRPHRWDVVLLGYFAAQLGVYAFYWHDGQFIGPRFVFAAIPALLILAARAPFLAAPRLAGAWRRVALIVIPVSVAVTWLRAMPPFGVQALAKEFRESRQRLKVEPPPQIVRGSVQNALIFVQEGTATRLLHRMWGLGVSRPEASSILSRADHCSLVDALRAEEVRPPADSAGRVRRILASIRDFKPGPAAMRLPDPNLRITDSTSVTPACAREINHDLRVKNTIAYGGMLLFNRFEGDGVGGSAVYVMDLGERNVLLRQRFANRHWYRYEIPRNAPDTVPVLVPYDSAR